MNQLLPSAAAPCNTLNMAAGVGLAVLFFSLLFSPFFFFLNFNKSPGVLNWPSVTEMDR